MSAERLDGENGEARDIGIGDAGASVPVPRRSLATQSRANLLGW
jgi:hypothetical protein